MTRLISRTALAALAVCAAGTALAQDEPSRYRLRDLSALTGLEDISVSSINNRGDFTFLDTAHQRNYLWRGGRLHDLGAWGGGTLDLNERGDVVGTRLAEDGRRLPFLWRDGRSTDLIGSLGAAGGQALAVNERGEVVGVADNRAFVFDGKRAHYLNVPGATTSAAVDINDHGLIVGRAKFAGDSLNERGFVTGKGGRAQKMAEPIVFEFGGEYEALSVNNNGNATVRYWDYNWGELGSAMYVNGRIFDLGYGYFANDLNDRDWAAGTGVFEVNDDEFSRTAYLFREGQAFNLNRLLTPASDARWDSLEGASSINDRGQVVGLGVLADGRSHAFLATPVPDVPGVVAMLAGLGVLGTVLRTSRRRDFGQ